MILVVSSFKKNTADFTDMLHYMGFLAKGVTPSEALSEINEAYRAIIVMSPSKLYSANDFVEQIRKYTYQTPIFAIFSKDEDFPKELFDDCFCGEGYVAKISQSILKFTDEHYLPRPGTYTLEGLDFSVDLTTPLYGFMGLPFTKTECMIIRYLIRAYPNPVTPDQILDHVYRPSRAPDPANIRTHISVINKKFRKIADRNLVYPITREGYIIATKKSALTV